MFSSGVASLDLFMYLLKLLYFFLRALLVFNCISIILNFKSVWFLVIPETTQKCCLYK